MDGLTDGQIKRVALLVKIQLKFCIFLVYSITRKFADVDNITTSDLADRIQQNQTKSDTDKQNQLKSDQIENIEKRELMIIDSRRKVFFFF